MRRPHIACVGHNGARLAIDAFAERIGNRVIVTRLPTDADGLTRVEDATKCFATRAEMLVLCPTVESANKDSAYARREREILKRAAKTRRPTAIIMTGAVPQYLAECGEEIGAAFMATRDTSGGIVELCPRAVQIELNDTDAILRYIRDHAVPAPGDASL